MSEFVVGLDVGNGFVKGTAQTVSSSDPALQAQSGTNTNLDFPSLTRTTSEVSVIDPLANPLDLFTDLADPFAKAFQDKLCYSFDDDSQRYLVGSSAVRSMNGTLDEFAVTSHITSKAEQALSYRLTLASLATKAIIEEVRLTGALPTQVEATVPVLNMALPINEFKHHRSTYQQRFTGDFTVTCHTFTTPIVVIIHVLFVHVQPEGSAGIDALRSSRIKPEAINTMIAASAAAFGTEVDFDADDVMAATSVAGIDIGEGTTNIPVYHKGQFDPLVSTTHPEGFGTVLTNTLEAMSNDGQKLPYANRSALSEALRQKETKLNKSRRERVAPYLQEQKAAFSNTIASVMEKPVTSIEIDLIYVYGGGSTILYDILYPKLVEAISSYVSDPIPVLYVPATMGRDLNRYGLMVKAMELYRAGAHKAG